MKVPFPIPTVDIIQSGIMAISIRHVRILLAVLTGLLFSIIISGCAATSPPAASSISTGPANGHLVLVGGGRINDKIWDEFKYLMGGEENKLVVIPTALNSDSLSAEFLENYRQFFVGLGFKQVTVLHTRDREIADSEEFTRPIAEASGVWFSGGRQ